MYKRQRVLNNSKSTKKMPAENKDMSIYELISLIYKTTENAIKSETSNMTVSYAFRNVLSFLLTCDGATQLDIAKALCLTPPTISVTLKKMESLRLVERKHDINDLRQTRVFLTKKSKELTKQISATTSNLCNLSLDALTQEEKDNLKAYLVKIANNL